MIKFFISSTFRDMFGERNLLHQKIVPELRKFGESKGEYIEICDLRWGLDHGSAKEDEKANLIMGVCLQEIDKLEPYFIAFLGDCYGTVPKYDINIRDLKEGRTWSSRAFEMSLTQIELEYAILQKELEPMAKIKPICLFRHWKDNKKSAISQSEDYFNNQQKLKDRLRAAEDTNKIIIIDYEAGWDNKAEIATDLEEMADRLQFEVKKVIETAVETSKPENWIESEFRRVESFCSQYTAHFGGRQQIIDNIIDEINKDAVNTICISGPSGYGKSALMAKIYLKAPGKKCMIACGYGEGSRSYLDVLKQLLYFVERKMNHKYRISDAYSEQKVEGDLRKAIQKYEETGQEKLVLLVDALDKISSYNTVNLHLIMDGMNISKITIICSQIEEFKAERGNMAAFRLTNLEQEDIQEIINENIEKKDMHFTNLATKLSKKKDKGSPLYITAALNILLIKTNISQNQPDLFDYYDKLINDIPEETEELIWDNIVSAGEFLGFELCEMLAGFLAAAQEGLRETDLEGIWQNLDKLPGKANWQTVDFVQFRYYLNRFFRCQPNGCWTFNHDIIKESVLKRLKDNLAEYQQNILNYIKTVEENDEVRIVEGLWACQRLADYDFAKTILEEAAKHGNQKIHTRVMMTLRNIVRNIDGQKWYRTLSDKYPDVVERILEQGLMFRGVVSYERRYLAKELTDIYQELQNRKFLQENLKKSMEEKRSLDEKIQFSSFCAEYVGIYEDISRQWEVFPYEAPVYELICNQISFEKLSEEQKGNVFKQANSIFYVNNRILNDIRNGKLPAIAYEEELVEKISQGIIKWYSDNVLNKEIRFKGRDAKEGLLVNNIAQYYSAHEDYEKGYGYRLDSIKYKTRDFLNTVGQESLLSKMEDMLQGQFRLEEHAEYWKHAAHFYDVYLGQKVSDDKEEESRKTSISAKWTRVAVSYRCIGSDYYNWDCLKENDDRLWKAYRNMKICLDMLNIPKLEDNEKEMVISEILMVGICGKLFERKLSKSGQEEFVNFIEKTVNDASQYLKLDKRELGKLRDNIDRYINILPIDAYYRKRLTDARGRIVEMI